MIDIFGDDVMVIFGLISQFQEDRNIFSFFPPRFLTILEKILQQCILWSNVRQNASNRPLHQPSNPIKTIDSLSTSNLVSHKIFYDVCQQSSRTLFVIESRSFVLEASLIKKTFYPALKNDNNKMLL